MNNSHNKPSNPNIPSHRPMHPTPANVDSIKAQFVQAQSNKVVPATGGMFDPKAVPQEVSEEQLRKEASEQKFYPFPDTGMICAWVTNPTRPGVFVVVVNIEPDITKEPKPGFFATCRQPEVAQMLCDGVNFLYKCQKEMELSAQTGEVAAPIQTAPVVVNFDGTSPKE
jgi:hypothetical protein